MPWLHCIGLINCATQGVTYIHTHSHKDIRTPAHTNMRTWGHAAHKHIRTFLNNCDENWQTPLAQGGGGGSGSGSGMRGKDIVIQCQIRKLLQAQEVSKLRPTQLHTWHGFWLILTPWRRPGPSHSQTHSHSHSHYQAVKWRHVPKYIRRFPAASDGGVASECAHPRQWVVGRTSRQD